jgi:hypothetical protein
MGAEKPDVKELFFEVDTIQHQQFVAELMSGVAKKIMDRGMQHDGSKFSAIEREAYIEPVWELNTGEVEYGSEEYKKLTAKMGPGWDHHKFHNDHHPEYFDQYSSQTLNDNIRAMDLFSLFEMLCDWIAAAARKNNKSSDALKYLKEKYPIDEQLEAVLRNTLAMIEKQ